MFTDLYIVSPLITKLFPGAARKPEIDPAILVLLLRRAYVQVGEREFMTNARREVEECVSYDRVIADLRCVPILEDEDSGWLVRRSSFRYLGISRS